jgi:hypothetical protein
MLQSKTDRTNVPADEPLDPEVISIWARFDHPSPRMRSSKKEPDVCCKRRAFGSTPATASKKGTGRTGTWRRWLVTPGHTLETGQGIQFHQGSGPAVGLVDGATYYVVRVDGDFYRLAPDLASALTAGRVVASSNPPTGVIDLTSFAIDPAPEPVAFSNANIAQPFNPTLAEATVQGACRPC